MWAVTNLVSWEGERRDPAGKLRSILAAKTCRRVGATRECRASDIPWDSEKESTSFVKRGYVSSMLQGKG